MYKNFYQAENAGSAVYKILWPAVNAGSAVYFCTLQVITYPDAVYKFANTAAILIQTKVVQTVLSLENTILSGFHNLFQIPIAYWKIISNRKKSTWLTVSQA